MSRRRAVDPRVVADATRRWEQPGEPQSCCQIAPDVQESGMSRNEAGGDHMKLNVKALALTSGLLWEARSASPPVAPRPWLRRSADPPARPLLHRLQLLLRRGLRRPRLGIHRWSSRRGDLRLAVQQARRADRRSSPGLDVDHSFGYSFTSSTRRFFARPSSLSLLATGASGPTP